MQEERYKLKEELKKEPVYDNLVSSHPIQMKKKNTKIKRLPLKVWHILKKKKAKGMALPPYTTIFAVTFERLRDQSVQS